MSIYTHTGDEGKTCRITGENVDKDDSQICFYGLLDELSSYIGWLLASFPKEENISWKAEKKILRHAQQLLFRLPLGFIESQEKEKTTPSKADVEALENYIDTTDRELKGLFKGFILPGGGQPIAAQTHIVRCVCRRIERELLSLKKQSKTIDILMGKGYTWAYLNRLSDFLYAMAQKLENDK